jgi:hypothetical protein
MKNAVKVKFYSIICSFCAIEPNSAFSMEDKVQDGGWEIRVGFPAGYISSSPIRSEPLWGLER